MSKLGIANTVIGGLGTLVGLGMQHEATRKLKQELDNPPGTFERPEIGTGTFDLRWLPDDIAQQVSNERQFTGPNSFLGRIQGISENDFNQQLFSRFGDYVPEDFVAPGTEEAAAFDEYVNQIEDPYAREALLEIAGDTPYGQALFADYIDSQNAQAEQQDIIQGTIDEIGAIYDPLLTEAEAMTQQEGMTQEEVDKLVEAMQLELLGQAENQQALLSAEAGARGLSPDAIAAIEAATGSGLNRAVAGGRLGGELQRLQFNRNYDLATLQNLAALSGDYLARLTPERTTLAQLSGPTHELAALASLGTEYDLTRDMASYGAANQLGSTLTQGGLGLLQMGQDRLNQKMIADAMNAQRSGLGGLGSGLGSLAGTAIGGMIGGIPGAVIGAGVGGSFGGGIGGMFG